MAISAQDYKDMVEFGKLVAVDPAKHIDQAVEYIRMGIDTHERLQISAAIRGGIYDHTLSGARTESLAYVIDERLLLRDREQYMS